MFVNVAESYVNGGFKQLCVVCESYKKLNWLKVAGCDVSMYIIYT